MSELPDRQEIIERKANVVRERLLRAVDSLDRQRHGLQSTGKKLAIAGGIGTTAAVVGAIAYFAAKKPKRTWRPLIEVHPKPPSMWAQMAERFLLGFTSVLASAGGRYLIKRLIPHEPDRQ